MRCGLEFDFLRIPFAGVAEKFGLDFMCDARWLPSLDESYGPEIEETSGNAPRPYTRHDTVFVTRTQLALVEASLHTNRG